ncbi:alkaline phosphatase D family protein [Paracoccus zeaxanthinifaciens]|uniref:alkaline phosphatase D family protein n=1 Tax=Paracoccus zeaxanthinifaciens TaxID=187400 RepID=UPI0003B712BF|nr:alkaline phosphatase D family protein [Paracoccus zeaxanthinifaciens]
MANDPFQPVGPILLLDDISGSTMRLAAMFIMPAGDVPGPLTLAEGTAQPERIADFDRASVWRARFALPADRASTYGWDGREYEVAGDMTGDLRLAYVSCNGEEVGDMDREGSERNVMWSRLRDEHRRAPFALMLHGGDQVYADEVTQGHPLTEDWPDRLPADPTAEQLADLHRHLRERFFDRYAALYAAPELAWLSARVPSLMQWDDHDICDGWGSLRTERTRSDIGQTLFHAAREAFLLFQHATTEGDLPARFADPAGAHLGWSVAAGDLRILAPDLRGERTRRRIMGPGGWTMMQDQARATAGGHTMLMSSVPLLGPRMSILETVMLAIPSMQKYEDDLRDQWQSRAHRDEWRRMLGLVRDMAEAPGHRLTTLSGEIHLATRAVMRLSDGHAMHQLVASGISHRAPPKAWARFLGMLSWLGEDPLPRHPIAIRTLPGQRHRYAAERNFLVLDRHGVDWSAVWHLEHSGPTPPLPLD